MYIWWKVATLYYIIRGGFWYKVKRSRHSYLAKCLVVGPDIGCVNTSVRQAINTRRAPSRWRRRFSCSFVRCLEHHIMTWLRFLSLPTLAFSYYYYPNITYNTFSHFHIVLYICNIGQYYCRPCKGPKISWQTVYLFFICNLYQILICFSKYNINYIIQDLIL